MIKHPFEAVFDKNSKILILGSFPSVKSREEKFFYGHPQNRFWKVIADIFNEPLPTNIHEKKEILLKNNIALWDVISSCEIEGSSDSTISKVVPNELAGIFKVASIQSIYCNGNKSYELYQKYLYKKYGRVAIKLPSTSPANASWNLNRLIEEWKIILKNI